MHVFIAAFVDHFVKNVALIRRKCVVYIAVSNKTITSEFKLICPHTAPPDRQGRYIPG